MGVLRGVRSLNAEPRLRSLKPSLRHVLAGPRQVIGLHAHYSCAAFLPPDPQFGGHTVPFKSVD
jgi:hypothetical protein